MSETATTTEPPEPSVRWSRDGAVATVVFAHQARRNAMTLDMWREVPNICDALTADPEVRVVVLRGAGQDAFVAGADISQFTDQRPGDSAGLPNGGSATYDGATEAAFSAIGSMPKPVLAAIHGVCFGGGLAMAVEADLRFAATNATFGLPPARLGVGYSAAGIATLVDLLGPSRTKELILTADPIDAETAGRWGLVNAVVPTADLDAFVRERAETIASRAPLTQRAAKLAVAAHLGAGVESDEVTAAIRACADSEDYREGVAAFLAKRPPQFRGR